MGGGFMRKKALLTMGLIILMGTRVNAQSVSFGPQFGYSKAQDADKGSYISGAAFRMKLTNVFSVEASIDYREDKYANNALMVRSWPVMATCLIYPLPMVYGAVGVGLYSLTYDYDQIKFPLSRDETTHKFGLHFGGGAELPFGTSFMLTGDIRYVFLHYGLKEIPGRGDLKNNFFVITVGLMFGL
jgi:hypothetical protein